jgi:hypothetical protein
LPENLPIGLTAEFWSDDSAQRRWQAFMRKNGLPPVSLEEICQRIGRAILAAIHGV